MTIKKAYFKALSINGADYRSRIIGYYSHQNSLKRADSNHLW